MSSLATESGRRRCCRRRSRGSSGLTGRREERDVGEVSRETCRVLSLHQPIERLAMRTLASLQSRAVRVSHARRIHEDEVLQLFKTASQSIIPLSTEVRSRLWTLHLSGRRSEPLYHARAFSLPWRRMRRSFRRSSSSGNPNRTGNRTSGIEKRGPRRQQRRTIAAAGRLTPSRTDRRRGHDQARLSDHIMRRRLRTWKQRLGTRESKRRR